MLNAKFQDHRTSCSREGRFLKVFTIYRHWGHLSHVTWTIYTNVCATFPRRLYIKFGFDLPSGLGEDVLKIVDRRTDGWAQRQWYTIQAWGN